MYIIWLPLPGRPCTTCTLRWPPTVGPCTCCTTKPCPCPRQLGSCAQASGTGKILVFFRISKQIANPQSCKHLVDIGRLENGHRSAWILALRCELDRNPLVVADVLQFIVKNLNNFPQEGDDR